MSLPSESELKKIAERALSFVSAPEVQVAFTPARLGNTRWARNEVTTSGYQETMQISVQAQYGKKKGTSVGNQLDDDSLRRLVQKAEELARLAPDDDETMPLLGPQTYLKTNQAFDDVAAVGPDYRARIALEAIRKSEEKKLIGAGFVDHRHDATYLANNKGLSGYRTSTGIAYSLTARTDDGTGSGWGGTTANRLTSFDFSSMTARAIDLAVRSQKPVGVEPGNYTVILPGEVVADICRGLAGGFGGGGGGGGGGFGGGGGPLDARTAEEGRSLMSRPGGATRLGEKMVSERANLYTDPMHPDCPGSPFDGQGMATKRIDWIKEGVIANLSYSRYWAQKKGKEPTPGSTNTIMDGGKATIDEMVASTKRGLLLNRVWYVRPVDPQTALFTGLTRDGLFLIEDGKVTKPAKNMRWNETPVKVLRNIEMMGPSKRVITSEQDLGSHLFFPSIKMNDFTFASLSDAV
jgi:predicted Zn-dependent protease